MRCEDHSHESCNNKLYLLLESLREYEYVADRLLKLVY